MHRTMARVDQIRLTVTWIGFGAVVLGAGLFVVPARATDGPAFDHLHQLPAAGWGALWLTIGALTGITAWTAWRAVLWPLCALLILMMVWAVLFTSAALTVGHGGAGFVGAVVWVWFAVTVWFATLRAARNPVLVKP